MIKNCISARNARVIRTEPVLNTDDSIEITQRHARDNDVKYIILSVDFKSLEQREKIWFALSSDVES